MIGQPINPEYQQALKKRGGILMFSSWKGELEWKHGAKPFVFAGLFGHITGTSAHCFCVFPTEGHSSDVSRGECTLGYVGGGGGGLERDRTLSDRHVQHPSPGPPLGEQRVKLCFVSRLSACLGLMYKMSVSTGALTRKHLERHQGQHRV